MLRRLSQKKMAKLLGISERTYQVKESGIREFYFDEAKKISEITGFKISEINFKERIKDEKHTL